VLAAGDGFLRPGEHLLIKPTVLRTVVK
jgi:hypothetical protein